MRAERGWLQRSTATPRPQMGRCPGKDQTLPDPGHEDCVAISVSRSGGVGVLAPFGQDQTVDQTQAPALLARIRRA